LWKSAELLVAGAVGLAERLGVSSLVIGLTVVAMGTSAPEVAASIAAAIRGTGDVAIGNVYGSNIANLALVGGLCAFIRPIRVQMRTIKYEMPAMLIVGLLLMPILHNLSLSRPEGIALLGLFFVLILTVIGFARRGSVAIVDESKEVVKLKSQLSGRNFLFVIVGLIGLAAGAEGTVRGAIFIGERIGLSKAVIGLTVIAIGTSLPELVTCLVAAIKGHDDISIGNLVGSNIFNTLLVTGTAGTIRPFSVAARLVGADYWIMIGVSAVFMVMAFIGRRISRTDGILLFCIYIGYMVYVFVFTSGM